MHSRYRKFDGFRNLALILYKELTEILGNSNVQHLSVIEGY